MNKIFTSVHFPVWRQTGIRPLKSNFFEDETNNNSVFYLFSLFLICLLGSLSCTATHSGLRSDSNGENKYNGPQIIFLNYSIKRNKSEEEPVIILISKVITEGKIKINNSFTENQKPGDLICFAVNNQLEHVDSIIISDPLNITIEAVNENNELFKKEIELDSNRFSIRMQLTEKTDAIAIRKRINSKNQDSYIVISKIY